MRVTIQGLRRWILSVAALLLAIVAGFFIYGRSRFHHIERDLPARLGVNIQQTANGFSYSQSSEGHTLFLLKASRLVQLRAGHALLHDVDITLYGPPGSGRSDHIYGSNFDYDQKTGIAVSQGEVKIDLQGMNGAPSPDAAPPPPDQPAGSPAGGTIHVRTSGLTFAQKTGDAVTAQRVDFQLPRAAGTSVGASYNSKTGVLVLDSQVHITTANNGNVAVITAAHATLLRTGMQAFLDNDSLDYETMKGNSDHATVWFRKDGSTEKIDAAGHVHMTTDTGATVNSGTAVIQLDPRSQPTRSDLGGGVQFADKQDAETMHGSAAEGTLLFAADPANPDRTDLHHGQFRHQVAFAQQIQGLPHDPDGRAQKALEAQTVDVDFAPAAGNGRQVEATRALAEGAPVLTTEQIPSEGPRQSTRISGDRLIATFAPGNTLRVLDGHGNTHVLDQSSDGARDTSQGETLHATFAQVAPPIKAAKQAAEPSPKAIRHAARSAAAPPPPPAQTVLESAVQEGGVILTETSAGKPGDTTPQDTITAWADHADYHASSEVLHLTGKPRIVEGASMQMSAEVIDYHRDTQDASGAGDVKATYNQPPQKSTAAASAKIAPPTLGGNGPVHVIADRAALHHATSESFFYGLPHAPARMWQDADSLIAPIIEIDRNKNILKAWADDTGNAPVVDANFTTAMGGDHQQSVVRVHSQTLVYSDKERRGDFHGAVTAEQTNQVIRCDDALVFLQPAPRPAIPGSTVASGADSAAPQTGSSHGQPAKARSPAGQNSTSQIDRIVATGNVVFTEPGRKGTGNRLVYTADNGQYVLTGTPATPPRMTDRVHGATTGAALLFNTQNDSVEVSGGKSSAVTDTRAPK